MSHTSGMNTAQHVDFLNKYYAATDKGRIFQSQDGRWGFYTLGCTISYAGKTRASAEKKMAKWDADSVHWERVNNGGKTPTGLTAEECELRLLIAVRNTKRRLMDRRLQLVARGDKRAVQELDRILSGIGI